MVNRRELTSEYVKSLVPPDKGEKWISDTKVKGFGVRLWGGKTSGKSFAIRINLGGSIKRKSIFSAEVCDKFGYLELARKIAKNEIKKLKDEYKELNDTSPESMLKKRINRMTFDELADYAIENQKVECRSKQYIEDNQQRYYCYFSDYLGKNPVMGTTIEEINDVLYIISNKPAQRRNLRSFINYMVNLAYYKTYNRKFYNIKNGISELNRNEYRVKYEELNPNLGLKEEDFDILFEILKSEKEHTQKADFIHLLFLIDTKPRINKLLKAQWVDFFVTTRSSNSWRTKKEINKDLYIWKPDKIRWPYHMHDGAVELLRKIKHRNEIEYPDSSYLFPSKQAYKTGHMSSYIDYWYSIKGKTGLPDVSLVHLVKSYSWMLSPVKICFSLN